MQATLDMIGRRVLVTGAAGAIGAAIARAFADCGAAVTALDATAGPGVTACDVTDEAAVEAAFDAVGEAAGGPVTDVVHAAGVVAIVPVAEQSVAEFRRVIDVNLTGSFLVARAAARRLTAGGTLTFVSSQAGFKTGALWGAYGASKAGVNRLVDALAEELGPAGVRVNAVCPGTVRSAMLERAVPAIAARQGRNPATVAERYRAGIPLGRFAEPEEIASVCVFLASDHAGYMTGALVPIDGGELSR
ncbi:MAG: SDR family oxidoreductase [Azospirillaceae bacterium]